MAKNKQLLKALRCWESAAYDGDSNDAEHDAATDLADLVAEFLNVERQYGSEYDD